MLLLPRRGIELWKDVREVVLLHSPAPVVVLLPFADDRLEEAALRNGAQACCSLWENLDAVRLVFRRAGRPARRARCPDPMSRLPQSSAGGRREA